MTCDIGIETSSVSEVHKTIQSRPLSQPTFEHQQSNFNIACPKMTIKTLGQEPKIRVGRV
jgi:hypothetical protein